jgi:hypothetical protein
MFALPFWLLAWMTGTIALASLRVVKMLNPAIDPGHVILHQLRFYRLSEHITVVSKNPVHGKAEVILKST